MTTRAYTHPQGLSSHPVAKPTYSTTSSSSSSSSTRTTQTPSASPSSTRSLSPEEQSRQFPKLLIPRTSGLPAYPSPHARSADTSPVPTYIFPPACNYGATTRRPNALHRRGSMPNVSGGKRAKSGEPAFRKMSMGRLGQKLRGFFPVVETSPGKMIKKNKTCSMATTATATSKKKQSCVVEYASVDIEHWADDY